MLQLIVDAVPVNCVEERAGTRGVRDDTNAEEGSERGWWGYLAEERHKPRVEKVGKRTVRDSLVRPEVGWVGSEITEQR